MSESKVSYQPSEVLVDIHRRVAPLYSRITRELNLPAIQEHVSEISLLFPLSISCASHLESWMLQEKPNDKDCALRFLAAVSREEEEDYFRNWLNLQDIEEQIEEEKKNKEENEPFTEGLIEWAIITRISLLKAVCAMNVKAANEKGINILDELMGEQLCGSGIDSKTREALQYQGLCLLERIYDFQLEELKKASLKKNALRGMDLLVEEVKLLSTATVSREKSAPVIEPVVVDGAKRIGIEKAALNVINGFSPNRLI